MRVALIILGLIPLGYGCKTQKSGGATFNCVQVYDSSLQQHVYTTVDKMPVFEKADISLHKYFTNHFHYPNDQEAFQGSINLVFIVDEYGKAKYGRILNKDSASLTLVDKEALRVLNNMPLWTAGLCNGKKVPVRMYWPIRF
ncbi:TonB protein C-terminal [Chitinophaga jiangningensis]|uniref:TonB protein C-terminal n=1 Tax=Chitinophaga jiangningensis TaxID=1419482 RepID=A0A1M6V7Y1_9BACT|nr:energy transducer TonB [Chitinophaga jiangningensis]SHK77491.1 TonB protein C-terminal [Chitinophaga jiangningensis]